MKPRSQRLWAAPLLAMSLVAGAAQAQSSENDVLRRAQMQLRQSEQERNTLRAEVANLQAQLAGQTQALEQARQTLASSAGEDEVKAAKAAAFSAAKQNQQLAKTLQENQQELERLRAERQQQERAVSNAQLLSENARRNLELRSELVELCRARNQELYGIGNEILTLYRDQGFGDTLAKREPVFQLKKVKLENAMQAFEDRLREQRMYPDTLPPSLEKKMQESVKQDAPAAAAEPR